MRLNFNVCVGHLNRCKILKQGLNFRWVIKRLTFGELLLVEETLGNMGCFSPLVGSLEAGAGWIQMLCRFIILKVTFFYMKKGTEIESRVVERVSANLRCASAPATPGLKVGKAHQSEPCLS